MWWVGLAFAAALEGVAAVQAGEVRLEETQVTIPTYELGAPERNPIFYTQESYQGAQKRVYPYALQDFLTHEKTNRVYRALTLENDFIRVVVLPELGGRLFEGYDKSNGYHFFYRQRVIKPALIGMLGAWISGGIEWCVFHHHRNTTYLPVDYTLESAADGSKTLWIGETERRHRMQWILGLTLRPDRSYLEVTGRFVNRTSFPHSILYWANVAVHVNEDYQVIFPPSVQVATYHSKIEFTHWPLSQGRYRGVDYTGVDLSWWKNHPDPVSFFAWELREDFMGGYDHGRQAGVVHVADHQVVPGAKLWEWGTGTEGRMWDQILTDEDGPYAELMVGAYSDNQPDYSWIQPGEVKTFRQCWYPVREIGGFKHANLEGALNLERRSPGVVTLGFHPTAAHASARVVLRGGEQLLFERVTPLAPGRPFRADVPVPTVVRDEDLRVTVEDGRGRLLGAYQPRVLTRPAELPRPVAPPPLPKDVPTTEDLYLQGLRIEQIHNPTVNPLDYYQEAVRRDPNDTRARTRLGLDALRRGLYGEAEQHLRVAVARVTADYTRSPSGEPLLYLGLALRGLGRDEAALDAWARASWDPATRAIASGLRAELLGRAGRYGLALEQVDGALVSAGSNSPWSGFKAALLRKLGRAGEAGEVARAALAVNPLDFFAWNEAALSERAQGMDRSVDTLAKLRLRMRDEVQNYLELACDYLNRGLWDEAIEVLQRPAQWPASSAATYPLVHYYLGYLFERIGDRDRAREAYGAGNRAPGDYCFPFRSETEPVLRAAIKANAQDARAWYYLGNLLYEWRPQEAMESWERARSLDDRLATVHRNLGWGEYRWRGNLANAVAHYERAVECDTHDPRLLLELDTLFEFANAAPERRLRLLETHQATAIQRNESFTRLIKLWVLADGYDQAVNALARHFFHVREGGGEIHDVFVDAHLLRGLRSLQARRHADALEDFQKASEYPENLSVGRPKNDRRAPQVAFYVGQAWAALGAREKAAQAYQVAANQTDTERWPETQFYQARAWQELGQSAQANALLDRLIERGTRDLGAGESADFFAKFGEQETRQMRTSAAHYVLGLGHLGKGNLTRARAEFEQAVKLNQSHVWSRYQLTWLKGDQP